MVVFCLFLIFVLLKFVFYVSRWCDDACPFYFAGHVFRVRSLLLSAVPVFLRTYSRFDLVRFRLSCDHGWVRSGLANNVR